MKIMSIDASSKSSGVAVFENKNLIHHSCITSASTDLIKRIKIMQEGILNILKQHPEIETVILEEVRPETTAHNMKTHKALMWLQCAIVMAIYDFNKKIKVEYIYPNSWRAELGIKTGRGVKRDTLKAADIEYVKQTFNITVNDDIADAIGIGYAFITKGKSNEELNWE